MLEVWLLPPHAAPVQSVVLCEVDLRRGHRSPWQHRAPLSVKQKENEGEEPQVTLGCFIQAHS